MLLKIEAEKTDLQQVVSTNQDGLATLEQESREQELRLSEWSSKILDFQQNINQLIQKITETQSHIALHQSRNDDLKVQESQQRAMLQRTGEKLGQLTAELASARQQMDHTQQLCQSCEHSLQETEQLVGERQNQIDSLQEQVRQKQEQQNQLNLLAADLGKQLSAADSRRSVTNATNEKLLKKLHTLDQEITGKSQKLRGHQDLQQRLQNEAAEKDSALQQARSSWQQIKGQLDQARKTLAEKRRAQTGATQRAEVIQELENRLEGVDVGVKELLERHQSENQPWLQEIRGLVADVIKVNVQHADLVDTALGEFARCLIVDGSLLIDRLASGQFRPSGRVRLIQLNHPPTLGAKPGMTLGDVAGVAGRMDQLVQVEPEYHHLVSQLLSGTFLVKTLQDALRLHQQRPGVVRFITLQGEVLEADGTLIAGPRVTGGIVSRRSELRALHREIHKLSDEIREEQQTIDRWQSRANEFENQVNRLLSENTEIATRLNEQASAAHSLEQQIEVLQAERQHLLSETTENDQQIQSLKSQISGLTHALGENEQQLLTLLDFLTRSDDQLLGWKQELQTWQQRLTTWKVQLAKSQQQHEDACRNHKQLETQSRESQETTSATRSSLASMLWQARDSRHQIAVSSVQLTDLESQRQQMDRQLKSLVDQRNQVDATRQEVASRIRQARDAAQKARDRLHEIELRESQLSMERTQLAQRLQDDYGIDVSQLDAADAEIDEDRDAVNQEITDLRRKIGNIGSVNMDALLELEEMQQRFEALDAQYQDLVKAREALEKIIQKINNDSRRLFEETLNAIRTNFQKLFRQTFGGGHADLVLEEDVDILEAGIDIMATPPGKPEFNNSLLSGGERALTAVSLLMAIFQFRPSPFCVLDEVDAPFDEANVGRFIDVLKSFLDWTKFVIVTHSKVTMTAATTLYGVTMQESGVSKRVSVRFEDVSDNGEISDDAINRDADDEKVA